MIYVCLCLYVFSLKRDPRMKISFKRDYTEKGKKAGSLSCWDCGRFSMSYISQGAEVQRRLKRIFPRHPPGGKPVVPSLSRQERQLSVLTSCFLNDGQSSWWKNQ